MGVFDEQAGLFEAWEATLAFRSSIRGGIPKNPEMIEGWLRSKAGIEKEDEVRRAVNRTVRELYPELELDADAPLEVVIEAISEIADEVQTQGFKRDDDGGLYVESRQVKAMVKENTNALYGRQERWGPTKKGPKNFVAEHLFVDPERIYLGRSSPDSVDQTITHTRHGASIGYVEAVERPTVKVVFRFDEWAAERLLEKDDGIRWARIMTLAQDNGLGADRSQGFGAFDVIGWTELPNYDAQEWRGSRLGDVRDALDDAA